ncbi:MAG: hypothetical protein ACRC40_02655 [Fusobacteriaceae bacterium]
MKKEIKYSKDYAERCMNEIIKKVRSEDYSEAIQDSKMMFQMLVKDLLEKSGLKYIDGDLKKSFDNLKVEMSLSPTDNGNKDLKKIIDGITTIIYSIDEIDGENSTKIEAKLYLSLSVIISEFILDRYSENEKNRVWS